MEYDVRKTKEFNLMQKHPELYQRTLQLQQDLAKVGVLWHNPFSDECTHNFGCCEEIGEAEIRIPRNNSTSYV